MKYSLTAGTAAVVIAAGLVAMQIGTHGDAGQGQASAPSTDTVVLASGTYHGQAWYLMAYESGGHLCMDSGPQPSLSATATAGGDGTFSGGQCRFYQGPGVTYSFEATGPDGSSLDFGPLPASATQIRVATHEITATRPFPAGRGLPSGRFWVQLVTSDWPLPSEGSALSQEVPLNASGKPVSYQDF